MVTPHRELGRLFLEEGNFAAARPELERALAIRRMAEQPEVVELCALGDLALAEGAPHRAVAHFADALVLGAIVFRGKDHPMTVPALVGLGEAKLNLGQPAVALPLLERAARVLEEKPRAIRRHEVARLQFQLARALWGT